MHHQPRPAHLQMLSDLYAASLQEYEKETGITLSNHLLAWRLRYYGTAESVTAILQEQLPACSELGGADITKSLISVVSVLYALPVSFDLDWVRSKVLIRLFRH